MNCNCSKWKQHSDTSEGGFGFYTLLMSWGVTNCPWCGKALTNESKGGDEKCSQVKESKDSTATSQAPKVTTGAQDLICECANRGLIMNQEPITDEAVEKALGQIIDLSIPIPPSKIINFESIARWHIQTLAAETQKLKEEVERLKAINESNKRWEEDCIALFDALGLPKTNSENCDTQCQLSLARIEVKDEALKQLDKEIRGLAEGLLRPRSVSLACPDSDTLHWEGVSPADLEPSKEDIRLAKAWLAVLDNTSVKALKYEND